MGDSLIGVLVGGFLTLAGLFLTELFRYLRERGAREAGRRRRRDDFQRTTLLKAQEALVEWIQATRNLPSGGSRFLAADQEPFDREELARQRLTILRERLLDDEARSLLEKASELQLDLRRATLDEIVVALEKLTDQADRCLSRMGSLARGLW